MSLVYLDPPYWKQAEGQYSQDATDLATMDLETFTETLTSVILQYAAAQTRRGHEPISPCASTRRRESPDHRYPDHLFDLLARVKLPLAMRISCPSDPSQVPPEMVAYARAQRTVVVVTRDLVIWDVA